LYSCLFAFAITNAFLVIPNTFTPAQENAEVPKRLPRMKQHRLSSVDYSYMILNMLAMPGLFYHFVCLMRSWGLDFTAPPLYGIYPSSPTQMITETLPEAALTTALYMLTYELFYYYWHRMMHEMPVLYTWVHKHHHQQTYPDRPTVDTFNTACLESQLGLYMQLGTLWLYGEVCGISNLPAGIWFFTIAGWLSVLEHDKLDRALPLDIFRADEHHMHHSFVRCNYSPYTSIWDRVFGAYKPFEVSKIMRTDMLERKDVSEPGLAVDIASNATNHLPNQNDR